MDEIGCMCTKCNCNNTSLLVTAVCDSCLKGNHCRLWTWKSIIQRSSKSCNYSND